MAWSAIGALVIAAIGHGIWNLLAKRSVNQQVFIALAVAAGALMLTPFALTRPWQVGTTGWILIVASALFELIYYLLLGGAYARGDMSVVYPLARGSSPLFVMLIAFAWHGETPSPLGLFGVLLVVVGVYILPLRSMRPSDLFAPLVSLRNRASQLALLTGLMIAGYSVVDKEGVKHVDPVLFYWLVLTLSVVVLLPYLHLARPGVVAREWRNNWRNVLIVGVILVAGYLIILYVLMHNPVGYATAVRSISVPFGALLGVLVLKERFSVPKLIGTAVIFAGVACIGWA